MKELNPTVRITEDCIAHCRIDSDHQHFELLKAGIEWRKAQSVDINLQEEEIGILFRFRDEPIGLRVCPAENESFEKFIHRNRDANRNFGIVNIFSYYENDGKTMVIVITVRAQ